MENCIEVRLNWLIRRACEFTRADPDKIQMKTRKREYVYTRDIVWFILKKHTELSLGKLGQLFADYDHATVLNAKKVYQNLCDTDRTWKIEVDAIEKEFIKKFVNKKDETDEAIAIKSEIWNEYEPGSRTNVEMLRLLRV